MNSPIKEMTATFFKSLAKRPLRTFTGILIATGLLVGANKKISEHKNIEDIKSNYMELHLKGKGCTADNKIVVFTTNARVTVETKDGSKIALKFNQITQSIADDYALNVSSYMNEIISAKDSRTILELSDNAQAMWQISSLAVEGLKNSVKQAFNDANIEIQTIEATPLTINIDKNNKGCTLQDDPESQAPSGPIQT